MLQESYHPGLAIPRWSVSVWTLYAQNDQFLYNSIVHPYHKGSTDKTAVVYLLNHAMILPVLGMNQDEPCTDKYIKCTAMFMHCIYHVQTRIYIPEFICSVYPRFRHDYTKTNIHVHAHRMYVLRICLLCTISLIYEHENQKVKIWLGGDSNPWPFACQSLAFTTALPVMM
jgi:hypothetical protein